MKTSIVMPGVALPESEAEFQAELGRSPLRLRYVRCLECGRNFDSCNTWTPAGWRETQITGLCEEDFDGMFS